MSEIIEKKGVKVTIVEHEGGSEEFHVMEEKINEYLNTHSEVDGILRRMWRHIFAWCRRKNEEFPFQEILRLLDMMGMK